MRIPDNDEQSARSANGHVQPLLTADETQRESGVSLEQPFVAAHRRQDDDVTLLALELLNGSHFRQLHQHRPRQFANFGYLERKQKNKRS